MRFFLSSRVTVLFLILLGASCVSGDLTANYDDNIRFHWKGALTSHSINMKVFPYAEKLAALDNLVFLMIYTKDNYFLPDNVRGFLVQFQNSEYPFGELNIDSLSPQTLYHYAFVFTKTSSVDSNVDYFTNQYKTLSVHPEFNFTTLGMALTAYNFTFGVASCAHRGSEHPIFEYVYNDNPNFFLQLGDLHYSDIEVNDPNLYYEAYHSIFASPTQRVLYQNIPLHYAWDDHDYGPNDGDASSPSKPAATLAFKNFVPYSELKNSLPSDDYAAFPENAPEAKTNKNDYLDYNPESPYGIFRSFIVGRCLFIMLDTRSNKDLTPGDILGDEQKIWLENQFRFAEFNQQIRQVFITSSVPWVDIDLDTAAAWEDYKPQQQWIGGLIDKYLTANDVKVMMLAGDAHMLALDDGRNNLYGNFPVVQAASLDSIPGCKGGPYSHGLYPGRGQYGYIEVTDDGDENVCVKVLLKRFDDVLIAYDTCHPELFPAAAESVHCPPFILLYIENLSIVKKLLAVLCTILLITACVVSWRYYKAKRAEKRYNPMVGEKELVDRKSVSQNKQDQDDDN